MPSVHHGFFRLILRDERKILERWKEYFDGLLNEESPRDHHEDGIPFPGVTKGTEREEVVRALKRMKNNKA